MMEHLVRDVADTETGAAFLITAAILALWGAALVVTEYRAAWHHWSGWRRFLPPTFSWWLGMFILSDAGLWGFLGVTILTSTDEGVPLWAVGYFSLSTLCALVAFAFWARER